MVTLSPILGKFAPSPAATLSILTSDIILAVLWSSLAVVKRLVVAGSSSTLALSMCLNRKNGSGGDEGNFANNLCVWFSWSAANRRNSRARNLYIHVTGTAVISDIYKETGLRCASLLFWALCLYFNLQCDY
jgi:hypothetical protein